MAMSKESKYLKRTYGATIKKITVGKNDKTMRIMLDNGKVIEVEADKYEPSLNISVSEPYV